MRTQLCIALSLASAPSVLAQSGWTAPVPEAALNSSAADTGPHLSFDGLTLHFASYRTTNWEIWSATRTAVGGAWSAPVQETALGGADVDDQPFLDLAGTRLWLASTRPGGAGGFDLLVATRAGIGQPWGTPAFVTELNSTGSESAPSLTADGLEVYFLSTGWGAPFAPNNAVFRATRAGTGVPFGTPAVVAELLTPNTHRDVEVAPDGLSILYTEFVSPRLQVYYAERTSRTAPFGTPVMLGEFANVGTAQGVYGITRSYAGNEAFLAAGFAATAGGQELLHSRFNGLTHAGAAGGGSTMALHYRDEAGPGKVYALGAALGTTGFPLGSRHVPLDADWLLMATFATSIPPFSTGWAGLLDGAGEGSGTLTNLDPALVGFRFHVGGFTLDLAAPQGVAMIGNAFAVELR